MSLILKISDVAFTDNTLPILSRDSVIDAGSKFVFDFADTYCFAKQAAPVHGDAFVNLVDGGANAVTSLFAGNTLTFAGGGIGFDGEGTNESIMLPTSGNLPANNQGFVFCTWIKHKTQVDTNYNAVAGYAYQAGANCQYAIGAKSDTNKYRVIAQGLSIETDYPADGTILQLASAVVKVGANMVMRGYRNGVQIGSDVLIGAASSFSLNQVPGANMAQPMIGFLAGFSQTWIGSVYRTWLTDTSTTGVDPLTLVAKDYTDNNGRFS